eukprot:TRINITY_DN3651_c0_g1_i2.p1 TRINITY_DN3651_c0_g1~~TRINITY_DN3651_c0_g1_i2.p1  ORF type:complete len:166 (-),score=23.90 TRINITY_DN3651_c0_g1_i2:356-853(-)
MDPHKMYTSPYAPHIRSQLKKERTAPAEEPPFFSKNHDEQLPFNTIYNHPITSISEPFFQSPSYSPHNMYYDADSEKDDSPPSKPQDTLDTWVTVYGIMPRTYHDTLAYLEAHFGKVICTAKPSSEANWLNVQYVLLKRLFSKMGRIPYIDIYKVSHWVFQIWFL